MGILIVTKPRGLCVNAVSSVKKNDIKDANHGGKKRIAEGNNIKKYPISSKN